MAVSFKFYHDSALTQEITAGNPITATQDTLGTIAPVDKHIYFGSTATSTQAQADSNPGVDQVYVDIVDAASGSGEPDTALKLATTQAGLDSATAGSSLNIGTTINSGSGSAVSVWLRIDDATATVGSYTDLSLQTNTLLETPV